MNARMTQKQTIMCQLYAKNLFAATNSEEALQSTTKMVWIITELAGAINKIVHSLPGTVGEIRFPIRLSADLKGISKIAESLRAMCKTKKIVLKNLSELPDLADKRQSMEE